MPDVVSSTSNDRAGVILPPPLIYLFGFMVALALRYRWPLPIFHSPVAGWLGTGCVAVAVVLAMIGRGTMQRAGTNINPYKPTSAIVTSGPFKYSRNPLYVALSLLFLGLTFVANTWWGIVLFVPVAIVMHFCVVLREERYLESKFGNSYGEYRKRVRRYF
jgi:protein-S-isoprenylcysteine O-methyltransferase Ste14